MRTYVRLLSVECSISLLGKRDGGHDDDGGKRRRRECGCAKLSKAQEGPSPCGHDRSQISPLNHAPLSYLLRHPHGALNPLTSSAHPR